MFTRNSFSFFIVLAGLALAASSFSGCRKRPAPSPAEEKDQSFNKHEMLGNLADQVILPAYADLRSSLSTLGSAFGSLKSDNSETNLASVRTAFNDCYLKYQKISPFEFGPAEEQSVRVNFNIFPCDSVKINTNIRLGNYNLATAANINAKGLPALDYLFNTPGIPSGELAAQFTTLSHRSKYVDEVLAEMDSRLENVSKAWNTSYRSAFVNSLGTDVGSSIGFLINQLNYELDYLKNAKIATPLGLRSDGKVRPGDCEAFHSARSNAYALATLEAIKNLYTGTSRENVNGKGFDDYVDHLGLTRQGTSLNSVILGQFTTAKNALQNMPGQLSDAVTNSPAAVNTAYQELVKLLVLLKTDLPSGLGVVITYQDGDGD